MAMSQFSVVTSQLEGMSARLATIARDAEELSGQVGRHASAAAQTPADGALNDLMGRWAAALPHFGLSGDRLQAAMRGAAAAYATTDAVIGDSATGGAAAGPSAP